VKSSLEESRIVQVSEGIRSCSFDSKLEANFTEEQGFAANFVLGAQKIYLKWIDVFWT
jgi:hypothetical protein